MSPQPAAPPAPQLSDVEEAIEEAKALERERYAIMQKIADNREYLRLQDRRDKLDEKQGEWLDGFYPLKEKDSKRSKEEIERTRKLREEARKEGKDE